MELLAGLLIALAGLAAVVFCRKRASTTVFEYQQALKYVDGKLAGVAGPGSYMHFGARTTYVAQDMRPMPLVVAGQEVPTNDNISVRISLVGHSQITDLRKAVHDTFSFHSDLHTAAQLAVRDAVAQMTLDEIMAGRGRIDDAVADALKAFPESHGVKVIRLVVRDITLPANLKKAMAGVLEAQKDAQRNLERVRGEQAVLRSLANAAKLYQDNPQLLNARLVQALDGGGNTVVFGGGPIPPTPVQKGKQPR